MRLVSAVFIGAAFMMTAAICAQEINEKVIVINDAILKSGKDEVGKVPAGAILQVREVNTDWLWVQYEGKSGWINQEKIIIFSAGYDYFTDKIATTPGLGYYIYRSNILIELGRWEEAVQDCNKALEYDPNNTIALSNLAYSQLSLKNYDAAILHANSVISKNPADAISYNIKGVAYLNKGEAAEATKQFDRAIELNPKFIYAYLNRSNAHSTQLKFDNALVDINKALELQPQNEVGISLRGNTYFQLARFDDAITDFSKLITMNPNNALALINRASAYNEKQEYQKAMSDTEAALKISANNPAAYNNRGYAQQQLKQYEAAIADYRKAIELNPNFAIPWRNLADLYVTAEDAAVKNLEQALDAGLKSCELSKESDWKCLRNLAMVYAAKKDFGNAITSINKALILAPEKEKSNLTNLLTDYSKPENKQ